MQKGWTNSLLFPPQKTNKKQKQTKISRRLSMRTTTGFTFGTHGGRAGLKTSSSSSSSSSSLVRQFLPSSLVRFLDAHNNNTFDSSSSRFRRGRNCALFSTNAAGNRNDSRQQQQQQQQQQRGRGGRGRGGRGEGRERRGRRQDVDSFDDSGGWGAGLRNARQGGGGGGKGGEKQQLKPIFSASAEQQYQHEVTQSVGGGAVPPPAPPGWKPSVREDMQNDFDAIRAATTEPPRDGMRRPTKKTSSSAQKNTATNRFKENRGKGGDEERKRLFQRQMDQFKQISDDSDSDGDDNYDDYDDLDDDDDDADFRSFHENFKQRSEASSTSTTQRAPRQREGRERLFSSSETSRNPPNAQKNSNSSSRRRRGEDAYQDQEAAPERAPVSKGMSRFFVTCHPGLEEVVAKELSSREIRAQHVEIGASGVSFVGTLETAYNANIWLRSGTRVLCELASGDLDPLESGFDSVYDFVKHCVPWQEVLINAELTFSIEARVWSNSQISSTKLACTRAKDAICDYISDACGGIRPRDPRDFRGNKVKADVPLFMTLYKDRATLYRDTSGDSLHRRGYRANLSVHRAALNEAAAAGLLHIAGWPEALDKWRSQREEHDDILPPVFIDPMCGSGTMVVEAALMAMNVAPGLVRYKNGGYAFQNWPDFNEDVFLDCIDNAEKKRIAEEEFHQFSDQKNKVTCLGNDIHPGSVSLAQRSALAAGVPHVVKVYQSSVDEWVVPPSLLESKRRSICTNPPWGKRISLDSRMSDVNRNGSGSSNRDSSYGGENGYNNEDQDNDEERWGGGDGGGDDYNEILPGDVNSTEAGDAWRKLGIFLKREMPNQSAFVLSGDPSISREIYMRASRKHVLGIGGVDTRLLRYDILPPKPKKADF